VNVCEHPAAMRVTHISIVHRPWDTRIFHKECRALAAAGHEVHLVIGGATGPPQIDGVNLHSISGDPGRPRARRQWSRLARATRCALRLRPSIFHLHDPHLIPLGILLKALGARVVYDRHEDYPAHGRSKLAGHPVRARLKAGMWRLLEWLGRSTLDGFVCASPDLAAAYPAERTVVVANYPLRAAFPAAPPPASERENTVIYTGSITAIRGFWEFTRAIELLPDELDCRLALVGSFNAPDLLECAREGGASHRIDILPWQPHDVLVEHMQRARAGLILLHPGPNHGDPVRSNKLFEYMAAGLPVIASDLPRWRDIVCDTGCGLVVDPFDPEAIAAAIQRLVQNPEEAAEMGRRGRAAFEERFNWDAQAEQLLSLYQGFAQRRTRPGAAPAHHAHPRAPGPRHVPTRPSEREAPAASRARTTPPRQQRESV
jgi:glycosyltransferase involved in cell wall biosynthesis